MLKAAKKFNGPERKKTEEQEQKSPPEQGKIVDMPLITSANMISIMRKETTTDTATADAVKTTETTAQKYSPVCKVDKRNATNVSVNTVSVVKKTEIETSSRMSAQSVPSDVGESVKRMTTNKSECANQEGKEERVELASLTSLKNEETAESDQSKNVSDKINDIDNVKESPSSQVREVDGECEGAERKKFCFDSSRELAGEPDGKADEEEVTEPPALPTSPPPIITTEPRPSFLHGSVNTDSKTKPAVPQKPVIFPTKANPNDGPFAAKKILNGDYDVPPPSVQTATGKPVQNLSESRFV